MRIAYCSDLHFEFRAKTSSWLPVKPGACNVLVLAGDIGVGHGAIQLNRDSQQWLYNRISEGDLDKTVVVTHFPPCAEARHGAIPDYDSGAVLFVRGGRTAG